MNCDRIARLYRWAEYLTFGPFLWHTRCAWLDRMTSARSILLLGDGDGRFLAALIRQNQVARIDVVDLSSRMLSLARQRLRPEESSRVHFHHADILEWTPPNPERYDLVVGHFFMDCFSETELERWTASIIENTSPDTRWILSDFQMPEQRSIRPLASALIAVLYAAFRWTTGLSVRRLPNHGKVLEAAGLSRSHKQESLGGILMLEEWRVALRGSTVTE